MKVGCDSFHPYGWRVRAVVVLVMVVAVGDTVDVPLGSLTVVVGPPSDQPVSHHANLSIHNQHSSVGRPLGPTVPWFGPGAK